MISKHNRRDGYWKYYRLAHTQKRDFLVNHMVNENSSYIQQTQNRGERIRKCKLGNNPFHAHQINMRFRFPYSLKNSAYIIIGILVLGGFGVLGYFVGEGLKSEIQIGTERPLAQNPRADVIAGSGGIKING